MDIIELSQKMEGNLLDYQKSSVVFKQLPDHTFSPRVTRSRTRRTKCNNLNIIPEEPEGKDKTPKKARKIDDVENIYLNKKSKVVKKHLETIYEDPIWKSGNTELLGRSKIKRYIYLDREFRVTSKVKSKLRKMKVSRLGKKFKAFKISDDEFTNKMSEIENYINDTECGMQVTNDVCDTGELEKCKNGEICDVVEFVKGNDRCNENFEIDLEFSEGCNINSMKTDSIDNICT